MFEAHPDQNQGRDRHHWGHLQHHRVRIERAFHRPALAEGDGEPHLGNQGGSEPLHGHGQGGQRRCHQRGEIFGQRLGDSAGRGQHIGGNVARRDDPFPQAQQRKAQKQRQQNVEDAGHAASNSALATRAWRAANSGLARKPGPRWAGGGTTSALMRPGRGVITKTRSER